MPTPYTGLQGQTSAGTIGLPNDYINVQANPAAFGAGVGQAAGQLGAAVQQAGGVGLTIGLSQMATEQTLQDHAAVTQAIAQKQTADRVRLLEGNPNDPNAPKPFYSLKGSDAVNAYAQTKADLQTSHDTIRAKLQNERQQLLFDKQTSQSNNSTLDQMATYQLGQRRAWQDTTTDAAVTSARDNAVGYYNNPQVFQSSLSQSNSAIADAGTRNGWDPAFTSLKQAEARSKIYTGTIGAMAGKNPMAAWQFLTMHQDQMLGPDREALEAHLRPQVEAWSLRSQGDRIMAGATPSGPVPDMIKASAARQGYDPADALATAKIESGLGAMPDRPGSQYRGVYQMGAAAWAARGGTADNRNDRAAQVDLGIGNLVHSRDVAQSALGRAPQGWETYVMHQQGDAGGPALLTASPTANAVDALAPAYKGDRAMATRAIVGNGGTADMSAGAFLSMWKGKYGAALAGTNSGPSARPYVVGDSIAQGVHSANPSDGGGVVGASPDKVLDNINAMPLGSLQGRTVVLSSGVSNDPSKLAVVADQVASLKARGAASVQIMGVGTRPDLAGLNDGLAKVATDTGSTFTGPLQNVGTDGVHPTNYRGQGVPMQPSAAVQPARDVKQQVDGWLAQARTATSPFGAQDPVYQDKLASYIKQRTGEIEFAQNQKASAAKDTLLSATMGLPTGGGPLGGDGVNPGPRPTSLPNLLSNPDAKAAWDQSSPEVQRSTMAVLEHNARGEDPPMTPAAQQLYYALSGQAVNDRGSFQQLDLSDPKYIGVLPHSYWNALVGEQNRFGKADVKSAQREETQSRALSVLKPDLLAAGIKVDGIKPGSGAATTYDQFVGRLRGALDDFQTENKRRPTDQEMGKIGGQLLLQGTQRGSGWLFGDKSVKSFQVEPGEFAPTVPDTARKGIVAAYQARNNGAVPTDAQVSSIFMAGQGQATAKQPSRVMAPRTVGGAGPAGGPATAPAPAATSALPSTAPAKSPAGPLPPAETEPTTALLRGY